MLTKVRSIAEAEEQRRLRHLSASGETATSNNFGGMGSELWCEGGEVAFVRKMVSESKRYADRCMWFTSLVSRKENLKKIEGSLFNMGKSRKKPGGRSATARRPLAVERIRMGAGKKHSTILAWSFLDEDERGEWGRFRGWV